MCHRQFLPVSELMQHLALCFCFYRSYLKSVAEAPQVIIKNLLKISKNLDKYIRFFLNVLGIYLLHGQETEMINR